MRSFALTLLILDCCITLSQTLSERSSLKDELDRCSFWFEENNSDSLRYYSYDYLQKAMKLHDEFAVVVANLFLGYSFEQKGIYDSAVIFYLSSISYAEERSMHKELGQNLSWGFERCGVLFQRFKAYDLSIEYFKKMSEAGKVIENQALIDQADYSIAGVYNNLGKYDKAIRVLISLTKRDLWSGRRVKVLNRMAVSYYYIGNFDSSIYLLRKKLLLEDHDDFIRRGDTYQNLALAFGALSMQDSAEMYFEKALEVKKLIKNDQYKRSSMINTYIDYSSLKKEMSDYESARSLLLEAEHVLAGLESNLRTREWYFELYSHLMNVSDALGEGELKEQYKKKYDEELENYTKLLQKYNMQEIVDNYFTQLEEEKRQASLKLYGGIISSSFLLILALTFSVNRYQKIKTKKKLEQEIVDHKLAELKALKAQINPHFLFNALNSIQSFILEDKNNVAEAYLVKYGKLMRKILDHSNELTVPLHEELEALQLYVELEQLRVKQGFDFEVKIDENIDCYTTQVPSMVIQPFIENAIWHGVSKLEGKGKIVVEFLAKEDFIEVRIEDNGVGFDINEKSGPLSNSKGIQLVRDRIELLNSSEQMESNIVVSSELGKGTKVWICYSSQ